MMRAGPKGTQSGRAVSLLRDCLAVGQYQVLPVGEVFTQIPGRKVTDARPDCRRTVRRLKLPLRSDQIRRNLSGFNGTRRLGEARSSQSDCPHVSIQAT